MELRIGNKSITAPIDEILKEVRKQAPKPYFKTIGTLKNDNIAINCPYHKDGAESHPSCYVYANKDNPEVEYGHVKCFTCGRSTPLYTLVGHCFGKDDNYGKAWLVDNFGDLVFEREDFLPEIVLDNKPVKNYLDESILERYAYIHPYMYQRKLTDPIINKFKIGYDKDTDSITFPIWDASGHLVSISRRSVKGKRFYLEENLEKPVYLLNFIIQEGITNVLVCESQINCLTAWSWGLPAVALFGTGSKYQLDILKKSGIRSYLLCFDGDEAGDRGRDKFIKAMNSDVLISSKVIPRGRDLNDLTYEEFKNLEVI